MMIINEIISYNFLIQNSKCHAFAFFSGFQLYCKTLKNSQSVLEASQNCGNNTRRVNKKLLWGIVQFVLASGIFNLRYQLQ